MSPKLKEWSQLDSIVASFIRESMWGAMRRLENITIVKTLMQEWISISKDGVTTPVNEILSDIDKIATSDYMYAFAEVVFQKVPLYRKY